jgi:hypothetical protein
VYVSSEAARDLVQRGATVRVHSDAIGCDGMVMAEGKVIAYCPAPSLLIEHADGSVSSWSVDLPITEISTPT